MQDRKHFIRSVAILVALALCGDVRAQAQGSSPLNKSFSEPLSLSAAPATQTDEGAADVSQLADMDLESLMNLQISTGTLTRTERHLVPAAITSLDRADIDNANPRSLTELLDIYVPGLHWEHAMWEPFHIGIRGIISDREDKYLLLLNGRVMNERTHSGALSERDTVLLGDLQGVDVIRGPGSATYGPGAISGVMSLQTYSGLTFQGSELTARLGEYEEFYSLEYKYGKRTGNDSGYFIYGGIAKYNGADRQYSPLIQGQDFDSPYGPVRHGDPVPYPFLDDHGSYRGGPQIKFHAQVDGDGFTLWTRYTYGGQNLTSNDRVVYAPPEFGGGNGAPPVYNGYGYQQLTTFAGYKRKISDKLSLEASTSFDVTEFELVFPTQDDNGNNIARLGDSHTEDKWINKVLLHWDPTPNQQVAGGIEYGHFWLGLPSWRSSQDVADRFDEDGGALGGDMPRWQTDLISFVGEHQWKINEQWTTFLSGRADKHTFTDWMYSPRAALAFSPTHKDTFKAIGSQSVRTNFEEEMKIRNDSLGKDSDPEKARTVELRYERQQNVNTLFAASVFYNDIDALGWDDRAQAYTPLGNYESIGGEFEANYRSGDTRFTFSHTVVKLVNINFDDGVSSLISARTVGVGEDLANWPDQITKLTLHRDLNRHWSADASVRVEWGFPGDRDFQTYLNDNPPLGPGTPPSSVPGWREPYGPNVFLNAGIEHRISEHATLRFDAYNILGWVDRSFNKREFLGADFAGEYREEAPAVGISFRYRF